MEPNRLPISALPAWATFNGVSFDGISVQQLEGDASQKGFAVVAVQEHIAEMQKKPLLKVPRELLLSTEFLDEQVKADKDLRQLLEALSGPLQVWHMRSLSRSN